MIRSCLIRRLLSAACTGIGFSGLMLFLALTPQIGFASPTVTINAQCNLCVGPCLAASNGACLGKACNPPATPAGACNDCSCAGNPEGALCVCIEKISPEDP